MFSSIKKTIKCQLARLKNDRLELGSGVDIYQSIFGPNVRIAEDCKLVSAEIGGFSYVGPRGVIIKSKIGKFCSIASDVHVGTGSHPSRDYVSSHPIFYLNRKELGWSWAENTSFSEFRETQIGNDVWLGERVTIRDGIKIGDGAIIGAGAVVVKDVEPYAIYGGVPARLIRMRFSPEEVRYLMQIKWWDNDQEWLIQNSNMFQDIKLFMDYHKYKNDECK